jgi:uncharacterized protein (DUF433 family)
MLTVWKASADTEGAKYRALALSAQCGYRLDMSDRIEINRRVCGGQPVIKGTRIPVATILEQLADDESWDSLLRGYPELTRDDIHAALGVRQAFHSAHRDHRLGCCVSRRAPLPGSDASGRIGCAFARRRA